MSRCFSFMFGILFVLFYNLALQQMVSISNFFAYRQIYLEDFYCVPTRTLSIILYGIFRTYLLIHSLPTWNIIFLIKVIIIQHIFWFLSNKNHRKDHIDFHKKHVYIHLVYGLLHAVIFLFSGHKQNLDYKKATNTKVGHKLRQYVRINGRTHSYLQNYKLNNLSYSFN